MGRLVKTRNDYSESNTSYKNGRMSSISHNNDEENHVVYNFDHNNFGNIGKISVGEQALLENIYDGHNGLLRKSTYGNGDEVHFDYDKYERLIGKTCTKSQDAVKKYTYSYNSNGLPFAINDEASSENVRFEYDTADRLTKKVYSTGTELEYNYDKDNIINEMFFKSDISSFKTTDEFKQQGHLTNSKTFLNNVAINRNLWYDNIGRLEGVNTSQIEPSQGGIQSRFTYVDVPDTNKTSTLVRSVAWQKCTNSGANAWENLGISYEYEYDENYNITKVLENGAEKVSFVYDAQNQLKRENNALIGKTIEYTYDFGGNILNKKECAYTTGKPGEVQSEITYAYADENWKDKLTSFNGEEITYDEIGNPLTYRDGLTMTWTEGRRLQEISKAGLDVSFEYGFDGVRRKKTINGEATEFITDGITIFAQKTGGRVLSFLTDGTGDTYGFVLGDAPHFYLKNVQGDVVGITDAAGNIEARYTYDTWGKLISIADSEGSDVMENPEHIGCINPLRYRGYYYDQETGLYYLNARYYDPETGRFINADNTLSGGLNLFAYCGNNPVNLCDNMGSEPQRPGYKFRTGNPMDVYWQAGMYIQTLTVNDPDDVEYAFVVYKDRDDDGDYYSYAIKRGNPGSGRVDVAELLNEYVLTGKCPDGLFGHTHGKAPRIRNKHYNFLSDGDIELAQRLKIFLGLFAPDGTVHIYDQRDKGIPVPYILTPPHGVKIPRDKYYRGPLGYFRRKNDSVVYEPI